MEYALSHMPIDKDTLENPPDCNTDVHEALHVDVIKADKQA